MTNASIPAGADVHMVCNTTQANQTNQANQANQANQEMDKKTTHVRIQTSDGQQFVLSPDIVDKFPVVQIFLDERDERDEGDNDPIPLFNVKADVMASIIAYFTRTSPEGKRELFGELGWIDTQGMSSSAQATLFDAILAANYLNAKDLLNDLCQLVADMIKGKTPEEIRRQFHIKNDFTPEEEEEIRRENQWAFD